MQRALIVLCLLLPMGAWAQDYSGVWAIPSETKTEFYSFHHKNDQLMIAILDTVSGQWMAYQGVVENYSVTFESVYTPNGVVDFTVGFSSETTGHVTIKEKVCEAEPERACVDLYGRSFLLEKIF